MTTTGMQIVDLITDNGKPAPDMTHALKLLGNGSMQAGLTRIGNHFKAEISAATLDRVLEEFRGVFLVY